MVKQLISHSFCRNPEGGCLTSTETISLIRDGVIVGKGGRLYTYGYIVTTGVTPALGWAVMRASLMFHNCEGQSHKTVSTGHNL